MTPGFNNIASLCLRLMGWLSGGFGRALMGAEARLARNTGPPAAVTSLARTVGFHEYFVKFAGGAPRLSIHNPTNHFPTL